MKQYKVKAIEAGRYAPCPESVIFNGGDGSVSYELPSYIFVLDSGDDVIICDTSFGSAETSEKVMANTPFPVTVKREKPIAELMKDNGIDVEKVETIILSHCHWDHAGGTAQFPNAKVYVQKKEWEFFEKDPNYGPEFVDELKAFADRVVLIDGKDNTTFEGIEMVPVGAHTVGSQVLFVDTPDEGRVCLAFDVIMCQDNIKRGLPIGLAMNQEEAQAAFDMIKAIGCKVYCGHDNCVKL